MEIVRVNTYILYIFENQPNEICSHLSEKALKSRLLGLISSKITLKKEKERRKRKSEKDERRRRKKTVGRKRSISKIPPDIYYKPLVYNN